MARRAAGSRFDAAERHLLGDRDPARLTILDIGAHRGESVARFRALFPGCQMHSFEPGRETFQMLDRTYRGESGIHLNNLGVSDRPGTLTFHYNSKSATSSFVPVDESSEWARLRSAQKGIAPSELTRETYEVPVTSVDAYLAENRIGTVDLLKIDTQGYEDAVLDGAQSALAEGRISVIETEIILGDAYARRLSFSDIERRILPHGYRFYGIDRCGDLRETPWFAANLLYVHAGLIDGPEAGASPVQPTASA